MKKIKIIFLLNMIFAAANAASVDMDAPKTIRADKIIYDVNSEVIKTQGNTEITNTTGQRMTLTDSYLSKSGDSLTGEDIKLWLGNHVYIESDNLTREGEKTVVLNATFTACDNCDTYGDAWEITTTKIVHNMDTKMLSFYNPVIWTYDIPVLWLPFFEMPDPSVKYKTGFLTPDVGSTNNMGTQINLPVYFAISDTHDATLTLSYLTKENPLVQIEHRLNAPYSEYRTNGAFTHNKAGESRWYIFNNDVIELGEYARATIYLERASDKTFLQKYGFYEDQPYLDSGAKLELFGESGYVVADAHIFQEMRTESTSDVVQSNYAAPKGDILPNVRATYQSQPLFSETYISADADVLGISGNGSSMQRMIGDVSITSPWTLWGGNRITANLSARYDLYNFNNTLMENNTTYSGIEGRFLPSGYVEWGLPLLKPTSSWSHIIEPRARLTVMDNSEKDFLMMANNDSKGAILTDNVLFSDNRFSGLDLWEDGTYSDYGVRYAAFHNDGQEFEIFLGQTYDFTDRPDTNPTSGFHNGASDYVGRIEYDNNSWLDLTTRFRVAETDLSLQHIETSAVIGVPKYYLNIGHMWSQEYIDMNTLGDATNEVMLGAGFEIAHRWSVQFDSAYNVDIGQFQRHTGGLFYNHPCYYLSVQYRRDNAIKGDYVGNTTFQFKFGMSIDGMQY